MIDDALMQEAMRASGLKTKRAVVEAALRDFIRLQRQREIMKLRGIGWEGDLDAMRRDDWSSPIQASGSIICATATPRRSRGS